MKKKSERKYFVLLGILILILSYTLGLILAVEASTELNFSGQWYSKGFSSVSLWKSFVNQFVSTIFKFKVVNENGNIKFGLKDESGVEYFFDSPVKYDNTTGELRYATNIDIPGIETKEINYSIKLNGENDLRKTLNPEDYFGRTIGEIVKDVLSKKIKIEMAGSRSNITVTANKNFNLDNPIMDVNYQKNINENFTSPIIEESGRNLIVSNLTNRSNQSLENNSLNLTSEEDIINMSIDDTLEKEYEIRNPVPALEVVIIFVNETKTFSIENSKNDSIKWYLNEKLMKKDSQTYSFKALKIGNYSIIVEIKEGLPHQRFFWDVEVKVRETIKGGNNLWIWIGAGLGIIVLIVCIIYFLKKRKNNLENQLPIPVENSINENF